MKYRLPNNAPPLSQGEFSITPKIKFFAADQDITVVETEVNDWLAARIPIPGILVNIESIEFNTTDSVNDLYYTAAIFYTEIEAV